MTVAPDGALRAITVTRNVYAKAFWTFNFHTWDTKATTPFRLFDQFDLSGYLGTTAVYPLNFCARVVGADALQFVVWKVGGQQPPWGSTRQGGSGIIPSDYRNAGKTGWYVGHVTKGTSTVLADLSVDGVAPPEVSNRG